MKIEFNFKLKEIRHHKQLFLQEKCCEKRPPLHKKVKLFSVIYMINSCMYYLSNEMGNLYESSKITNVIELSFKDGEPMRKL